MVALTVHLATIKSKFIYTFFIVAVVKIVKYLWIPRISKIPCDVASNEWNERNKRIIRGFNNKRDSIFNKIVTYKKTDLNLKGIEYVILWNILAFRRWKNKRFVDNFLLVYLN